MSEVEKKTYTSLDNPTWKIQNNSKIYSFVRKSLSNNRNNSRENYKKTQDDRINNYYNQTMEITLDDGKKESIQVLKKPRHPDEYRIVISMNDKKESHSYKIIPHNNDIFNAVQMYMKKETSNKQFIKSIHEWLDILISNNNDCTYILYENDHQPRMTSYEIIAIGNKLQSVEPLYVNVNGCVVKSPHNEHDECNANIECPGNLPISVYSEGGSKSKSRKLVRKSKTRKLGRKLGSRKYQKK